MIRSATTGPGGRGFAAAALLLFAMGAALAQEAAVTRRSTELREAPGESARSLASLAAQAPVTRLGERRGPWVQVRTARGETGWLHLFDVAPATGAAGTATNASGGNVATGALRGLGNLFNKGSTPGTGSTVSTSTIGIRGLGAEDIARAQPNLPAVGQMEALRQSDREVRDFAQRAALAPVPVEPLPVPARAPAAEAAAPGGQPGMLP